MKSMVAWCAGFLQNRLPVSGHALFLAYRVQPQTVFQECKKKKKKKADPDEDGLAHFFLFLTKSMFRPLCHTSERRRYGQIQSLFKVRPSVSNSLLQTADCLLCI